MKKILTTLMFVAIIGLVIGSVSATELQEHDFNGQFTLDVPGNYWMANANADGHEYQDGNGITVQYLTTKDINGATFEDYINSLGLKDGKADGDFTVFQNDGKYVVITNSTDEMYISTDNNLEEAKEIAESADLGNDQENNVSEKTTPSTEASVELKSQDFHGLFKMNVPKDSDFGNTEDGTLSTEAISFADDVNDLNISFIDDESYDDAQIKEVVDNYKKNGANVSKKDNAYIISANGLNGVILHEDTNTLMIISSKLNANTLTAMAESVDFD